jgi:DNA polymerase II
VSGQTFRGWLLDLYLNQQEGLTLWFISETDDCRQCFTQAFPVTFYAAGPRAELRRLWHRLRKESCVSALERQYKQDVFAAEPVEVLRVDVDTPARQVALFRQLEEEFQELTWYDADVTISTRYISRYGAFPLALCELSADAQNRSAVSVPESGRARGIPALRWPDEVPRGREHSASHREDPGFHHRR